MTIKILRQINLHLVQGDQDYLSQTSEDCWKGIDVPDKYKLQVEAGLIAGGYYQIGGSTSQTIALPEGYSSADRLFVLLSAFGQVRVTVVSPAHSNSVFTLNGTTTREAVATWNGRVTSITVTTPTSTAVKVRYSLYQLPDLTDPDSFWGGVYNFGSLT